MRLTASGERTFEAVVFIGVLTALLYVVVVQTQQLIAFSAPSFRTVALYIAATFCLFCLYVTVVGLASSGRLRDRPTRVAVWVAPLVIQAALIWTPPTLSIDLFSYLAHGRQVQLGRSPYAEPVKEIQHTDYGDLLIERGWLPVHGVSPYGPLWTWIETGLAHAATSVEVQIRLAKAVTVLFSLLCAWLIWLVLGKVAPERQWEGTLLYLWNPVVVVEFAAEGHNDALVAAGVLLSLFFTVSHRPGASLLALGSSALVKITSFVALLPQALLWWRHWRLRCVPPIVTASLLLGAAAVSLYASFWVGVTTLDGVWGHGRPSVQPSTQGVVFWGLTRVYAPEVVGPLLSLVMTTAFAAIAFRTSLQVTDERTALRACGRIAVAYLLLAPGYWPWYATLPIALLSLSPGGWPTTAVVLLSLGARLAAPIERLRLNGLMDWPTAVILMTAVGLWLPAAVALAASAKHGSWFPVDMRAGIAGVLGRIPIGRRNPVRRISS